MFPRRRQRSVLALEPRRAAATIRYSIVTALALAVCTSALLYDTTLWPSQWRLAGAISLRTTSIIAIVASCLALAWLTAAIINGRRWHIARAVVRVSQDAARDKVLPHTQVSPAVQRASQIPALGWDDRRPWKVARPPRLQRVTATRNVAGSRPLSIAYLRMFENQPRARTFLQGAWREFGYVYLLRSASSVTPAEFRQYKRSGSFAGLLIKSEEQFAAEFSRPSGGPSWKRWHVVRNVGPQTVWVRDWHGSYPPRTFLCHGNIWKAAVNILLDQADLVVLDLSGLTPGNEGIRHELQQIVDRVPIERVIFLADRRSDRNYLRAEIRHAWDRMAFHSPNSGTQTRVARLAVTDSYRQMQQQQGESTYIYYRLVARRWQSRRLATEAVRRLAAAGLRRPQPGPPPSPDDTRPIVTSPSPSSTASRVSPDTGSTAAWMAARIAQLAVLIGCGLFWISVAVLTHYVNTNGGESLLTATSSDRASPLLPRDFWILIVLAALTFVASVLSMLSSQRSLMIAAGVAALGLIAYTLYIPSEGSFPSFDPFGWSYWLSLAVAIVIALGAVVAAVPGSMSRREPERRQ
jgi:hypothetical protein